MCVDLDGESQELSIFFPRFCNLEIDCAVLLLLAYVNFFFFTKITHTLTKKVHDELKQKKLVFFLVTDIFFHVFSGEVFILFEIVLNRSVWLANRNE